MRSLLEVVCGLAALVVMVSFHHQIVQLEVQQRDVAALEQRLDAVAETVSDRSEIEAFRERILDETETRMRGIQEELANATAGSAQARQLEQDLLQAREELASFTSAMRSEVDAQKKLVEACVEATNRYEQDAALRLSSTQTGLAELATHLHRDPSRLTHEMLLPTVQLNGDDTVGSGTLVYSDVNPESKELESYALTSYHVVRNILADTPRARRGGFEVTVYLAGEKLIVKGKMVASKPSIDAALVQLFTDRKLPNVANVLPRTAIGDVGVWEPICAVGCPLGNDPVPTHGEMASLNNELNGSNYWMINAPTYFGNSGGGVYLNETRQLIGVFSKIYTHGTRTPVVVPHMGLCTPISLVYEWLETEELDHLLTSEKVTPIDLARIAEEISGAAARPMLATPMK